MFDKFLTKIPDKIIEYSFYVLFFLVPLVLTPINYELFEYNKMMLTYAISIIITGAWIIKIIRNRRLEITKTPLDIPIALFLISQIVSAVFSIDKYVSIWGYYSRFNGGLVSVFTYILLYYSFVTNFPREKIGKLFKFILSSAVLVSVYAVLEHLGIDKNIWVQDVQNRVFSTLGQPNWLAAYLDVLIPIMLSVVLLNFLSHDSATQDKSPFFVILAYSIIVILFASLLFTKSRSGMIALGICDLVFWLISFIKFSKNIFRPLIILNSLFLILVFLFGSPFNEINGLTLPEITKNKSAPVSKSAQPEVPAGSSVIEVGVTDSGNIRKIVWKGAIDIFKHYPLFGSGVETFAFSYYMFRPAEHNMTSEWDFLYNKAHNEYLNYAANTGIFGIGSYLLIIILFIYWFLRSIKYPLRPRIEASKESSIKYEKNNIILDTKYFLLNTGLFIGWLTILITNFFGFSVVIIQLFFFLIPAISFLLFIEYKPGYILSFKQRDTVITTGFQKILAISVSLAVCYLLFVIYHMWLADVYYAQGYHEVRDQESAKAYTNLRRAIELNSNVPLYFDELSFPTAELAVALSSSSETTASSELAKTAIMASEMATSLSPNNVNFWKTKTRVYYALATISDKYFQDAYYALQKAKGLSPTDPKIRYNLAILADKQGKRDEAISEFHEVTRLKPDYRDAYLALAYLYQNLKQYDKARENLNFILEKLNPNDEESKKALGELK